MPSSHHFRIETSGFVKNFPHRIESSGFEREEFKKKKINRMEKSKILVVVLNIEC